MKTEHKLYIDTRRKSEQQPTFGLKKSSTLKPSELNYHGFLITRKNSLRPSDSEPVLSVSSPAAKVRLPQSAKLPGGTKPEIQMFEDSKLGRIDDYAVGKLIGTGAYASVKSAVLKSFNLQVALKIYEKYLLSDPYKKENLSREITILKQVSHPNVIKLFEVIETPKQVHLVMEHITGGSLGAYIKKKHNKHLQEFDCKPIFQQLMNALAYLHSLEITHRDLKLENLLLDQTGALKIIDFGFSTICTREETTKMLCGTPTYMAPEIVARKEYSGPPTDVWAAGVILYVMLVGAFPFKAQSDRELFKKIEKGVFVVPDYLSVGASSLLHQMLNVDPETRIVASEVLKDPWLNEGGVEIIRELGEEIRSKIMASNLQQKLPKEKII